MPEETKRSKVIKITDEYSLHKYGCGWKIAFKSIEEFEKKFRGKKVFSPIKFEKHYGTLYQALQGLLVLLTEDSVNSLDDIPSKVSTALRTIDAACSELESNYKVVKVMK